MSAKRFSAVPDTFVKPSLIIRNETEFYRVTFATKAKADRRISQLIRDGYVFDAGLYAEYLEAVFAREEPTP